MKNRCVIIDENTYQRAKKFSSTLTLSLSALCRLALNDFITNKTIAPPPTPTSNHLERLTANPVVEEQRRRSAPPQQQRPNEYSEGEQKLIRERNIKEYNERLKGLGNEQQQIDRAAALPLYTDVGAWSNSVKKR